MGELEQVALIEESPLDGPGLDQLADRLRAQRRDPVDAVDRAQCIDLLVGDHPPVPDQGQPLDPELLSELLHLRQQGFRVPGLALEDRDGDGNPAGVGQQPVVDLELAALSVPIVTEAGQGTGGALEVAGGQIVQGQAVVTQVSSSELFLDRRLALH